MFRSIWPLSLIAMLSATGLSARPMTPRDVLQLVHVGEITVAPDGSRIAYTLVRMPDVTKGERNGGSRAQLFVAWGAGQDKAILPPDIDVSHLAFSPDGRTIAYLWGPSDGKKAVWSVSVDGGSQHKLAEAAGADVVDFAWSPDGRQVYMLAEPPVSGRRAAERAAGFDPIVYEEEPRFNRMLRAKVGSKVDARPEDIGLPGHVSDFALSNDGRIAVLQSAPSPLIDDTYMSRRVYLLDIAGGTARIVPTTGKLGDVELSPDGRTVALLAGMDANDPAATTLWFFDMPGAKLRPLNEGAAEAVMDVAWIDDSRLAAVIHRGAVSLLRIYNRDGTVLSEEETGSVVLGALASQGGQVAAVGDAATFPAELFMRSANGFARWTQHNDWLRNIDFGQQRVVRYTARDGRSIEGILIDPVGGYPEGGAPAILDIHGGPETHDTNGWNTAYNAPGQVAAGRGYAVFLPNYRGSTGYGTAFSRLHQGDPAGREFDDIADARNVLVERGAADPARVGITGGSYGGYATGWAATAQTELFAAGVMFAGISNQISKFGTTEIPREMVQVHERQYPWEDWQKALERSPVYHAGKARTPLLILHGLIDARVSPGQAMELYRHIKTRTKTPVRLVAYPGEEHGNRRAASRLDLNIRMMEWFDHYLKGRSDKTTLPPARPDIPGVTP